jgi:alkylation response protein AidB-like acyl-CoA dehydrogenase
VTVAPDRDELRARIRRWAEAEVKPNAAEADRLAMFPKASWQSYVAEGWIKLLYPAAYGGTEADGLETALLIEEMARVCASSSLFAIISRLGALVITRWGSPSLARRYVPAVARGDAQISYCLSELEAGSDIAAMSTRAVRDGDHYVLSGKKAWVTNAGVSDLYLVFAKTDPGPGSRSVSAFLVEGRWGVVLDELKDKMGMRGSPTGDVALDNVIVPRENMVGNEGDGFRIALGALDRSRPVIGAQALGIAQGAFDVALHYVESRRQFGRAIADFQSVQFKLADMAMRMEATRALVYDVCRQMDEPSSRTLTARAAMAKCLASDAAVAIAADAVQLCGANGYTRQLPVERMFRDAKATQIYEGTNEIQRIVISRHLLDSVRGGAAITSSGGRGESSTEVAHVH